MGYSDLEGRGGVGGGRSTPSLFSWGTAQRYNLRTLLPSSLLSSASLFNTATYGARAGRIQVSGGDDDGGDGADLGNGGMGGWTCPTCHCQNLGHNSICHNCKR